MTREDVVQAALTLERWCRFNTKLSSRRKCDCPLYDDDNEGCVLSYELEPWYWGLEDFLKNRGMKHD